MTSLSNPIPAFVPAHPWLSAFVFAALMLLIAWASEKIGRRGEGEGA